MKKILAITLLSLLAFVPAAVAAPIFSADVEINTTFDSLSDGSTINTMDMGGRVVLNIEGKIENKDTGFFVAGKGQPMAQVDGKFGMDDAWGQIGTKSFSLKIGRFEGIGLLDAGEDVYVASAGGTWYTANNARGRNNGGLALDFNASDSLLVQIGAIYGNTTYTYTNTAGASTTVAENKLGVRPVVKFTAGNITLTAGADIYMEDPKNSDIDGTTSKIGFGGQVTATVGSIKLNVGAASGKTEIKDYLPNTAKWEQTVTTIKGFANIPVGANLLGLGAGYSTEDLADSKEVYGFATYEYKLPVEGAWLKFAVSFASATDLPGGEDQTDVGGRVRLNYTF